MVISMGKVRFHSVGYIPVRFDMFDFFIIIHAFAHKYTAISLLIKITKDQYSKYFVIKHFFFLLKQLAKYLIIAYHFK